MKFITKKVIRGKSHYYFQYEGFSRHLGTFLPDDLKQQLLSFFDHISENKFKVLPAETVRAFPHKSLERLEKYHYWYLGLSESELFQQQHLAFVIWFSIFFTYNSNRAEGSKVTRPQIENFILSKKRQPKTRTDREIFNSYQTLKFAMGPQMKWTVKHIKHLHHLLLQGLEDPIIVGKWKNEENVAPGNQPTVPSRDVPVQMKNLVLWLKDQMKKKRYPPLLALEFYSRFEKIHPFLDGNGRIGRILLQGILHKYHYMPVIFFTENHQAHCHALNQAINGRSQKFNLHFLEQADKSWKVLSGKLQRQLFPDHL